MRCEPGPAVLRCVRSERPAGFPQAGGNRRMPMKSRRRAVERFDGGVRHIPQRHDRDLVRGGSRLRLNHARKMAVTLLELPADERPIRHGIPAINNDATSSSELVGIDGSNCLGLSLAWVVEYNRW